MPTTSSLSRHLNSVLATSLSSPPKTRCSSCFAGCFGMSDMTLAPRRLRVSQRREAFIPKQFDEYRVPVLAGRDKHPVPWDRTIINDGTAPDRRQRAARFVHQKISRRKVPVMTV